MAFGIEAADIREPVARPENHGNQPMSVEDMIRLLRPPVTQREYTPEEWQAAAVSQEFPAVARPSPAMVGQGPSHPGVRQYAETGGRPFLLPEERSFAAPLATIRTPQGDAAQPKMRDSDSRQFIGFLAARLGPAAWRSVLDEYHATFNGRAQ